MYFGYKVKSRNLPDIIDTSNSKNQNQQIIDPATGELDIGSWYVTHLPTYPPHHPELSVLLLFKLDH